MTTVKTVISLSSMANVALRLVLIPVLLALPDGAMAGYGTASRSVAPRPQLQSDRAPTQTVARKKKRKGKKRKKGSKPKPSPVAEVSEPAPSAPVEVAIPKNLPAPPALPQKYRAVAVFPLFGLDVGETLLHDIERALFNEVDEAKGLRAVSPRDVQNDLDGVGINVGACDGDVRCLATAGRYARSHLAISSRVAALGGTLSVSLRLIDTEAGTEIGRVAEPVSDDADERAQEIHRLAVQLLAPDTYVGVLIIKASTPGAEVYLDDRLIGVTPLKDPIGGLTAGPHILRVSKPGFADVNQFVDVVYKRHATITVDMEGATISGLIIEIASKTGFGSVYVACNEAGVEVRIDGEPRGTTILGEPIGKVAAGRRRISLRKEGLDPQSTEILVKVDQRLDIGVQVRSDGITFGDIVIVAASAPLPNFEDLVAVASTQPIGPTTPPAWTPTWKLTAGIIVAGIGVLSMAAGSYFGSRIVSIQEKYDAKGAALTDLPDNDPTRPDEVAAYNRLENRGKKAEALQWGLLGGGGLFVAAGAGLILWDFAGTPATGPQAEVSVTTLVRSLDVGVAATPGAAHVSLSGSW